MEYIVQLYYAKMVVQLEMSKTLITILNCDKSKYCSTRQYRSMQCDVCIPARWRCAINMFFWRYKIISIVTSEWIIFILRANNKR